MEYKMTHFLFSSNINRQTGDAALSDKKKVFSAIALSAFVCCVFSENVPSTQLNSVIIA